MYFTNRPELLLPSAPDTAWFLVCRAVLWITGIAFVAAVSSLWALSLLEPEPYLDTLFSTLSCVPIWLISYIVYISARERYEQRYWTAARVAQRCPYVWLLYRIGSTAPVSRTAAHWGPSS